MTTKRGKKKGLRKRKIKDKEREEAGRAPDKLLSQACRCRQGFGRRGGREGQKQREEVEYAPPVSSSLCKGHLSWHGLCATWLWTHLYRTEEIKKPGVGGEPPLVPAGWAHGKSEKCNPKQEALSKLQVSGMTGFVLGHQEEGSLLQGLP